MPVEPGDSEVEVHSLPVPARVAVTCFGAAVAQHAHSARTGMRRA